MPHPDMREFWVNGHPAEGLLHEWLDEQLSVDNAAAVESHVAGCAECGALVAEARGLIAASHRILSALDDVPANVIPVTAEAATLHHRVVDLATARQSQHSLRHARDAFQPLRTSTRWRQWAKVAAVLLVVLVPGYALFKSDGSTPVASEQSLSITDSSAGAAPSTAAPPAGTATTVPAPAADKAANAVATVASPSVPTGNAAAKSEPAGVSRAEAEHVVADAARMFASPPGASPPAATPPPPLPVAAAPPPAAAPATQPVATPLAASPPVVAADQVSQLPTRSAGGRGGGGRSATGVVENAPSGPVRQVSVAPTSALASPAVRSDSASLAREIAEVAKRVITTDSTARQVQRQRPLALGGALRAEMRPAIVPRTSFDSVTLTRTNCATSCETVVLHVSSLGAVRYSVSSGSTRPPAVMSQLSSANRDRISELLAASFAEADALSGQLRCTISRATGSPLLEVLITTNAVNRTRGEARCSTSDAELLQLGRAIESIVGVDALRRRVP